MNNCSLFPENTIQHHVYTSMYNFLQHTVQYGQIMPHMIVYDIVHKCLQGAPLTLIAARSCRDTTSQRKRAGEITFMVHNCLAFADSTLTTLVQNPISE